MANSHARISRIITAVILCVIVKPATQDSEGVVLKDLPASALQIKVLAQDVCYGLFEDEEKIKRCMDNLTNSSRAFYLKPSKLKILCRFEDRVSFRIPASPERQLAIAIPRHRNKFIYHSVVKIGADTGVVPTDSSETYSLWTTVLDPLGSPSVWLRGPEAPHWVGKQEYDVKLRRPEFEYGSGYTVNATLQWELTGDITSCSDITINNRCSKAILGADFETMITPLEHSITLSGLPLEDNCTLTFRGTPDRKFSYQTPACDQRIGCVPLPEIAKDIYVEVTEVAEEGGAAVWEVYVEWAAPRHRPETYNVTLGADQVYSVNVSGGATNVTFSRVKGEGLFNVSIEALSARGRALTSRLALFPVRADSSSVAVAVLAAWCTVMLVGGALVAAALRRRKQRPSKPGHPLYIQDPEDKFPKDCGADPGQESAVEDAWEVRPDRLLLHEVLGEGAFGVVRRGTLAPVNREPTKEVAVKMLKDFPTMDDIRSFRVETELMKSVGVHPHIVSLVGCCSGRRRPLIIAEYCSRGDLLSFLRCSWDVMVSKRNAKYYNNNLDTSDYRNDLFKSKNSKLVVNKLYDLQGVCDAELTSLDLLSFCRQIAMGMKFLASNRVVHRDLAARNVLVSGDKTLKIADFGLSRDVYQENQYRQTGNGKMPVKWMALESLTRRIYTTLSDVWSFGVVVWEVATVGAAPYPEVPAARLPRLLRAGYRMPRPNNCSKQLYDIMQSCWRARPRDRPTFAELHARLDALLHSACADEYLSLELEADEPHTPLAQRYVRMILRGNRAWSRGAESYERPLKAPRCLHSTATQSNHYTSPPLARPQPVG